MWAGDGGWVHTLAGGGDEGERLDLLKERVAVVLEVDGGHAGLPAGGISTGDGGGGVLILLLGCCGTKWLFCFGVLVEIYRLTLHYKFWF